MTQSWRNWGPWSHFQKTYSNNIDVELRKLNLRLRTVLILFFVTQGMKQTLFWSRRKLRFGYLEEFPEYKYLSTGIIFEFLTAGNPVIPPLPPFMQRLFFLNLNSRGPALCLPHQPTPTWLATGEPAELWDAQIIGTCRLALIFPSVCGKPLFSAGSFFSNQALPHVKRNHVTLL